MALKDPVMNK